MHANITEALVALRENGGVVPPALIEKFKYCSLNTSRYVLNEMVLNEQLSPARRYRTCLLEVFGKMNVLVDLYYGESKREREIERRQLKLKQLREQLRFGTDIVGENDRRLVELDVADLEEEILKIEDQRRLTKPLIDDALTELDLYQAEIQRLENSGELPAEFEDGEADYFKAKTLKDAKLEVLAQRLQLSRPVVEHLYRMAPEQLETLIPDNYRAVLTALAAPALPPGVAKPKLEVYVLTEREDIPLAFDWQAQTGLEGYDVKFYQVPAHGNLAETRLAALRQAAVNRAADYYAFIDGNLSGPPDLVAKLLESIDSLDANEYGRTVSPDVVPEKYGMTRRDPLQLGCVAATQQALDDVLALAECTPPAPPPKTRCTRAQRLDVVLTRWDHDTGGAWTAPPSPLLPTV